MTDPGGAPKTEASGHPLSHRAEILLVAALSLLALYLRVVGLSYGLPDHFFHFDTPKQLERVAPFFHGHPVPPDAYPVLHMYLVALLLKVLSLVDPHLVSGSPSIPQAAITARILNAALGAGMVPLVYLAGRRLFRSWPARILAATLVALSPVHVVHAHYEMGEIPQAFFVTASFVAATRVLTTGQPAAYVAAGALAGLAASAKYYGVVVFGALVLAAVLSGGLPFKRRARRLALAGIATVVTFAVTTPKLLVAPVEFVHELGGRRTGLFWTPPPPALERPIVAGKLLLGLALDWLGVLLLVFVLLGVASLARQGAKSWLLLSTPAFVIAVYVAFRPNYLDDRHLVILVPFLALVAAAAVAGLAERGRRGLVAAVAGAAVLVVTTAVDAAHVAYLFWQEDTRLFAERWAEQALPPSVQVVRGQHLAAAEAYRPDRGDVLLLYTFGPFGPKRHVSWYSAERNPTIERSLALLSRRGKLLKRFELYQRAFTAPTLAYYDLTALTPPVVFAPPDDIVRPSDALVFVDLDAVPEPLGVLVPRGQTVTRTLVSPEPLARLGVALSGTGRARVSQGWRTIRVRLEPNAPRVVVLEPWRTFPWFKYFYRVTVEAPDAAVYARLLPTPCELAQASLADRQWARAIPQLEACRGRRWVEPQRLLDLAWAHAQLGQPEEAARALADLRATAPGFLATLQALAAAPDGPAWQERYRALAGHARWFWAQHTFTLQAEASPAAVGTVIADPAARAGRLVRALPGQTPPGFLKLWFPQQFLRGSYLVRFRLRGARPAVGSLATLSVVRHFQHHVLDVPVSRDWPGGPADPVFHDVTLRLETGVEPVGLEARVFYHGTGRLEIDEVTIVPDLRGALRARLTGLGPHLAPAAVQASGPDGR